MRRVPVLFVRACGWLRIISRQIFGVRSRRPQVGASRGVRPAAAHLAAPRVEPDVAHGVEAVRPEPRSAILTASKVGGYCLCARQHWC